MTRPRILFLDHSGALGGAELYLLDAARAYKDHCTVLLFEEGPFADRLRADDIDVDVLPTPKALRTVRKDGSFFASLYALPSLAILIARTLRRAWSYDLFFANSQKSLLVAAAVSLLTGRPLIWNLHDLLTASHFTALNRHVAITAANMAAHHVIANSQATLDAFRQSGGHPPASVVYNGVAPERFEAGSHDPAMALRTALGVGEAPLVGVFSRLSSWKGQHVLLHALLTRPSVHAILVGDALFDGDYEYAATLHRLVEQHQLQNRVHFLGFREDIPALMRACDVVLHTSTAPEPFGRVIVEGMLAKRPVIATRAGGAVEIIEDGVTGHLVSPGDPTALGNALDEVLQNPAHAAALGRLAFQTASNRFSLTRQIDGITKVLRTVSQHHTW